MTASGGKKSIAMTMAADMFFIPDANVIDIVSSLVNLRSFEVPYEMRNPRTTKKNVARNCGMNATVILAIRSSAI